MPIRMCAQYLQALLATRVSAARRRALSRTLWWIGGGAFGLWALLVSLPVAAVSAPSIGTDLGAGATGAAPFAYPTDFIQQIMQTWVQPAQQIAGRLFGLLLVIEIAVIGMQGLLFKENLGEFLASFAFKVFSIGFFLWLIYNGNTLFSTLLQSFGMVGQQVSQAGNGLLGQVMNVGVMIALACFASADTMHGKDMSAAANAGIWMIAPVTGNFRSGNGDNGGGGGGGNMGLPIADAMTHILPILFCVGAGALALACTAILFMTWVFIMIESCIVMSAGVVFLGFAATRFTMPYAQGYLRYAICTGAKLFVFWLVLASAVILLPPQAVTAALGALAGSHVVPLLSSLIPASFVIFEFALMSLAAYAIPTYAAHSLRGSGSLSATASLSGAVHSFSQAAQGLTMLKQFAGAHITPSLFSRGAKVAEPSAAAESMEAVVQPASLLPEIIVAGPSVTNAASPVAGMGNRAVRSGSPPVAPNASVFRLPEPQALTAAAPPQGSPPSAPAPSIAAASFAPVNSVSQSAPPPQVSSVSVAAARIDLPAAVSPSQAASVGAPSSAVVSSSGETLRGVAPSEIIRTNAGGGYAMSAADVSNRLAADPASVSAAQKTAIMRRTDSKLIYAGVNSSTTRHAAAQSARPGEPVTEANIARPVITIENVSVSTTSVSVATQSVAAAGFSSASGASVARPSVIVPSVSVTARAPQAAPQNGSAFTAQAGTTGERLTRVVVTNESRSEGAPRPEMRKGADIAEASHVEKNTANTAPSTNVAVSGAAAERPGLQLAPTRPTLRAPAAATGERLVRAAVTNESRSEIAARPEMRKGAGVAEESDVEKDAGNMAPSGSANAGGSLSAERPRLNLAQAPTPPSAQSASVSMSRAGSEGVEEDDIVGAASPRTLAVTPASLRRGEVAPQAQTLAGVTPDEIKGLPSDRFRTLLTATPWGTLTIDQLEVIDESERLSLIANEVLVNMVSALPDDGEDI